VGERIQSPWQEFGAPVGAIAAIIVAGGLVGVRSMLDNTSAALILVLVIVGAASVGGRWAGFVSALAAGIAFDFFHTEPYGRLAIDSAQDVETVVLLVLVGVAAGEMVVRARRVEQARALSHEELARVRRVADTATTHPDEAVATALRELQVGLGLQRCWYEPGAATVVRPRIERRGTLDQTAYRLSQGEFELPDDEVALPVAWSGQELGRFVLVPTPGIGIAKDRRVAAVAIADLVASVLRPGVAGA
jgi:K+-sensing histidine kinase KdpD